MGSHSHCSHCAVTHLQYLCETSTAAMRAVLLVSLYCLQAAAFDDWKTIDLGSVCSCWSVSKSNAAAKSDLARLSKYKSSISAASTKYNIPKEIIMGIISRESRAGDALGRHGNKPGFGDHNRGFGLMQVDNGSHDHGDTSNIDNIDQGTGILADFLKQVKKKHPSWSLGWQMRGAVAAYNFGVKNVQTKGGIDRGSASSCPSNASCSGNYSWDTITRARWFANQ